MCKLQIKMKGKFFATNKNISDRKYLQDIDMIKD